MPANRNIEVADLGLIGYKEAWDLQQALLEQTIDIKMHNRQKGKSLPTKNRLLFCEHPHVYSIGKSGNMDNLLLSENDLNDQKIEFFRTNRGGDITYHGPGQLVCYPILDLENFTTDIHLYLRNLEETVMSSLHQFGLKCTRVQGLTGVWTHEEDQSKSKKVCAIGVRTSRWVTMHGLALNVNTDLSYFDNIIPCGIDDKDVTSMANELGTQFLLSDVMKEITTAFAEVFDAKIIFSKNETITS